MTSAANTPQTRSGISIVYVLLAMLVLTGFLVLGVDFGHVSLAKTELMRAVDAACRAGATGIDVSPAESRLRAKTMAANNLVDGKPLTLIDTDIDFGVWSPTTRTFTLVTGAAESTANALRVNGKLALSRGTALKLTFLPLLNGQNSVNLSRTSTAHFASGGTASNDIVLAQDLTQSFVAEVAAARIGDQSLLTAMRNGATNNFGLVAFTGVGKTISPIKNVSTNYAGLTANVTALIINGSGMPASGSGTDIAAGIEQAQTVFDAFTSAAGATRTLVIVSDGEPNASSSGKHPTLNNTQLLRLAQQDADSMYARGISISVVFWDDANSASAAANMQSLVRGSGKFIHVTDPTQLATSILNAVPKTVKLVQ